MARNDILRGGPGLENVWYAPNCSRISETMGRLACFSYSAELQGRCGLQQMAAVIAGAAGNEGSAWAHGRQKNALSAVRAQGTFFLFSKIGEELVGVQSARDPSVSDVIIVCGLMIARHAKDRSVLSRRWRFSLLALPAQFKTV